jgi:hypothetical protein
MKNTRLPKLINLKITPIAFKFQIQNDITPPTRGNLRIDRNR